MAINLIDQDGWGETVERYQWAEGGDRLLVHCSESLRVYCVGERLEEQTVLAVELDQVLTVGWAHEDWWLVMKHNNGGVVYRYGLHGPDILLQRVQGNAVSALTVSPDGQMIAGSVDRDTLVCWSTSDGKALTTIRFASDGPQPAESSMGIESLAWSPNSTALAVQLEVPGGDLIVVDVRTGRLLE